MPDEQSEGLEKCWVCDSCGYKGRSPQPEKCPQCLKDTDLYN